ncbi:MAG: DUF6328 family protein [Chloroflexota bacterium]|nr:DUF6328 family protein [Chloroflexota bacterium]
MADAEPHHNRSSDDEKESEKHRVDRELIELLNELRVALPGVQVLFAFLLTVPFTQRFPQITPFQRDVYFATLLASAAATVLLIAPSAYHRLNFRQHVKLQLLRRSNVMVIVGLGFLALAIVGVVLLITDILFATGTVAIVTAATAGAFALFWFVLPLVERVTGSHGGPPQDV